VKYTDLYRVPVIDQNYDANDAVTPNIPKPSYGAIFAPHTLVKFLIFLTVQILHRKK
jgi:hypothetical protein